MVAIMMMMSDDDLRVCVCVCLFVSERASVSLCVCVPSFITQCFYFKRVVNQSCIPTALIMSQEGALTAVAGGNRRVAFQQESSTAVADDRALEPNPAQSDSRAQASETDGETSIAGDTASEAGDDATDPAVAAQEREQRRAPKALHRNGERGHSAKHNSEPEVGNFGLFCGNWGTRATVAGKEEQQRRRAIQDRQILKSCGQVVVVAEASKELEQLLLQPPVEGVPDRPGLEGRSTAEHFVVRGDEESALLIAARTDNTECLEFLKYDVNNDHAYKERKKTRWRGRGCYCAESASSRTLAIWGERSLCAQCTHTTAQ